MIMLGGLVALTKITTEDSVHKSLKESTPRGTGEVNLRSIQMGLEPADQFLAAQRSERDDILKGVVDTSGLSAQIDVTAETEGQGMETGHDGNSIRRRSHDLALCFHTAPLVGA